MFKTDFLTARLFYAHTNSYTQFVVYAGSDDVF